MASVPYPYPGVPSEWASGGPRARFGGVRNVFIVTGRSAACIMGAAKVAKCIYTEERIGVVEER